MKGLIPFIVLLALAFSSCSKDEEAETIIIENSNVKMNRWVYSMMKHHYLWTEDLPDSTSLNYRQNMGDFFHSILSPKDRFSFYEANVGYKGDDDITRTINFLHTATDSIYEIDGHKIGYLLYKSFDTIDDLFPSLHKFSANDITDIIVDLRYNGGGYSNTAIFLASCLVPDSYRGQDAQYHVYNPTVTMERYGSADGHDTYSYMTKDVLRNCDLDVDKVYFLVSGSTASASESTILMLKSCMPVILIGSTTVGKGVGMYDIKDNRYPYYLVPITFRFYNAKWETVPDSGFTPDYYEENVFPKRQNELGNITEPLLARAISLITNTQEN